MDKHLVEFANIEWVSVGQGIRYKKFERDHKVLRLMELTDEYQELDWCMNGHIGVVYEGEFQVTFEEHTEWFKAGDIVFIPGGKQHKHKASVPEGKRLVMLSFEL